MLSKKRLLTEARVEEIRADYRTGKVSVGQLARHYAVNKPNIRKALGIWKKPHQNYP